MPFEDGGLFPSDFVMEILVFRDFEIQAKLISLTESLRFHIGTFACQFNLLDYKCSQDRLDDLYLLR